MNLKKIIRQAIDLHVHIGPEIIPRKFTLAELIKDQRGKIKAIGVKNHFFPTVAMASRGAFKSLSPRIIFSVALNQYVGGFNDKIITAVAELSQRPIIVWFPTISAANILRKQKYEIPPEWSKGKLKIKNQRLEGYSICHDQRLKPEVLSVLKAIKNYNAILATGHISSQESQILVRRAVQLGIKRIIVTHPIYQKINMSLGLQKELADRGAYIEQCYSMYSIDKIPISKIARQIKVIGADRCILSSDMGQVFSKSPDQALLDFTHLLIQEGITLREIKTMLVSNPAKLISR
ncbi:MAG: hypothetical protein A3J07_04795 [Candidatus Doudnabacteria bacterium RIFCSPLOWO2_02_FULL_49_13]|uniref:Cytosolic protein n=1 Tax=Candidatus Doudnabacteria bacterium RIFCSPHIGHO2_12_FULL_48_16 TaxID=1817838 RepID=A0A1F5PKM9_9BACT|nr:MAG: hypothetical protein A3B77_01595 [Candidatus Doudnabacteria bacterium RIFCSPHIGHO2_02_FULL_49_24]OGE89856.1 MAG: hypothetical protein A2760_03685 [Candidatus Doudnabacteria bacterium RIFCSPHIGHO2_01_FULL_50_67]OGE90222.1 MAG: hypothetical protein A3E29_03935 [Candidatus Doudnabacteria bacterium RIFCSPHIGHO2_12_FULL_48_16]OGE96780.1 MAG: hypothetical protein A2990_00510 [Candidatus Doudnabacteria bacterium RIFCSPLOWO2_01_FULL_49_40]OGF02857.1 MAG: hypothetical protein A3H14_00140 [Candid